MKELYDLYYDNKKLGIEIARYFSVKGQYDKFKSIKEFLAFYLKKTNINLDIIYLETIFDNLVKANYYAISGKSSTTVKVFGYELEIGVKGYAGSAKVEAELNYNYETQRFNVGAGAASIVGGGLFFSFRKAN